MNYDWQQELAVPVADTTLTGELAVPAGARALVLFAHGSGSSRRSPRNRQVARALQQHGIGTFLFDLLTPAEDALAANRFDIALLADRLVAATDFLDAQPAIRGFEMGYFGASTGAAAALAAAARRPESILAVVARGGRPDLAGPALLRVQAATLLLVGGLDEEVLALNRRALAALHCAKYLAVIPGATHLFEEPGTLEQVGALAADWFSKYLLPVPFLTR